MTRGRGNQGGRGLRPPSQLCFVTSEIEWSYIMHIVHIPDPIINLLVSVIQHHMNIPKNNWKIIRKMMNFRIEILPKEAPLVVSLFSIERPLTLVLSLTKSSRIIC